MIKLAIFTSLLVLCLPGCGGSGYVKHDIDKENYVAYYQIQFKCFKSIGSIPNPEFTLQMRSCNKRLWKLYLEWKVNFPVEYDNWARSLD